MCGDRTASSHSSWVEMSFAGKSRENSGFGVSPVVSMAFISSVRSRGAAYLGSSLWEASSLRILWDLKKWSLVNMGKKANRCWRFVPASRKRAVSPVGKNPPCIVPFIPPNSGYPLWVRGFLRKKASRMWGSTCGARARRTMSLSAGWSL